MSALCGAADARLRVQRALRPAARPAHGSGLRTMQGGRGA